MSRQINDAGIQVVKNAESCRLKAYPDPGTGGPPWTIGWGHTGPDVSEGQEIDQDTADRMLADDLARISGAIDSFVPPCTANQFSALVSFAYNEGPGRLKGSTLIGKLAVGDVPGAAAEFPKWVYAGGRVMRGLVIRRDAERRLFLTPDDPEA